MSATREWAERRRVGLEAAARQLIPPAIGLFSIPFVIYALVLVLRRDAFGVDFHYAFWPAAVRVVHGMSPYVDPHSPLVDGGAAFVYPAPTALLFAPFGWLDRDVGNAIFTAIVVIAIPLTMWTLAVRDWRVYGVVFMWAPIFGAWQTANITTLLGLGIAGAWRWRDRPFVAGALFAGVVSMKLFLWPVVLWLLATRRYAAVGWSIVVGVVVNAISWLVLGLGEIHRYTDLVRALTDAEERRAYSVISFGLNHGVSRGPAYVIGLALAMAVMAAAVVAGRRGYDARSLTLGLAASILASPLVWLHYFALLLVPVCLARPRLAPLWGLPIALWVCSPTRPRDPQLILAMVTATAMVVFVLRALPGRPGPPSDPARLRRGRRGPQGAAPATAV
jgi:hypothetical protein